MFQQWQISNLLYLFRRMIPELEEKLNVTFPPAAEFGRESFRDFLDDLCVRNNVECGHPRTAARLLDKVGGSWRISFMSGVATSPGSAFCAVAGFKFCSLVCMCTYICMLVKLYGEASCLAMAVWIIHEKKWLKENCVCYIHQHYHYCTSESISCVMQSALHADCHINPLSCLP